MSYIGNTPGVSSQRVVLEEVVSGSPKSAFVPQSGYIIGYVDVLVNGLEIDSSDFTAPDGVNINLVTAAAVGDTVKVKTWLPRGLSDGYLKSEADAKFATKISALFTGTAGFDVTPATWWSGGKQLQLGSGTALWDYNSAGNSQTRLFNNLYLDAAGTSRYLTTNNGAYYQQYNGAHTWGKAPNGTAGTVATTTDTMQLDALGNLAPIGNLVMANGKGIDFGASPNQAGANSELLDDYEVGTWTPVFMGNTVSGSCTYNASNTKGTYVKVGRMVTVSCSINATSSHNGTGLCLITGVPFTPTVTWAAANTGYWASLTVNAYSCTAYMDPGNYWLIPMVQTVASGNANYMSPSNIQNGTHMMFSCTFQTA